MYNNEDSMNKDQAFDGIKDFFVCYFLGVITVTAFFMKNPYLFEILNEIFTDKLYAIWDLL